MVDKEETHWQNQIPSEYFGRINGDTQYQLKATIKCKPRIKFCSYLEKFLSLVKTFESKETFSLIEIIGDCPTILTPGSLMINAFYNEDSDEKTSYLFGKGYTDVVKLKKAFNILTEKIRKGYPKSRVYFKERGLKPQDSKS